VTGDVRADHMKTDPATDVLGHSRDHPAAPEIGQIDHLVSPNGLVASLGTKPPVVVIVVTRDATVTATMDPIGRCGRRGTANATIVIVSREMTFETQHVTGSLHVIATRQGIVRRGIVSDIETRRASHGKVASARIPRLWSK